MVKPLFALSPMCHFASIALLAGFCLAGLASSGAQAPTDAASISGTVDYPDGTPIPGASVELTNLVTGQKARATTDRAGAFTLANPPHGPATIIVSAPHSNSSGPINRTVNGSPIVLNPVKLTPAIGPPEGATQHEAASGPAPESYVTVSSNAVAGPMGYAATPSLDGAAQSPQSAQQQAFIAGQQFNYPSIIFYVSAAPLVNLPSTDETSKIQASQETDRNPLWLDASFTLSFYDSDGNPLVGACSDGTVQVFGLMPQQTVAALKNQTVADVASAANDVAGALATFYPGASSQVGAATKAMNIVFQDIFPPKPVAFEYSDMTDNCDFGWFFRPNTTSTSGTGGQASILGIQTGIVLLKTAKSIASIKVSGRSLSAWNNSPTADNNKDKEKKNKLFLVDDQPIGTISLPSTSNIDYDNITSLVMFPSLIPKAQAMKILHIDKDADFVAFAVANKIVGTNATFDYITNKSLDTFLGLASPTPPDAHPGGGSTPDPKAKDTSTPPAAPAPKGTTTAAQPSTPTTTGKQPGPHPKTPGATAKPVLPKPQS
jgi:hypothetical protein